MGERFWETTSLADMSREQWESLCDGCGKCCLFKVEDEDSGEVFVCNVACRLLDLENCRCRDYQHRKQKVPDCIVLTSRNLEQFRWLPSTCAYRLIYEGKPLAEWHPLISGNSQSVQDAGISICGRVIGEEEAEALEYHITDWKL